MMIRELVGKKAILGLVLCVLASIGIAYLIFNAFRTKEVWSQAVEPVLYVGEIPARYFIIYTNKGNIQIRVMQSLVPKLSDNFFNLVSGGFYNGTKFHKVIPGQIVEGGDPLTKTEDKTLWGTGGPSNPAPDEKGVEKLTKGSVAAINGSQFFILLADSAPKLDGSYPIFGEVISGLSIAKQIAKSPVDENGIPEDPVIIERIEAVQQ
jgi:peptidyl-prolyl cis-trans isomerase B (cyclophilin B)